MEKERVVTVKKLGIVIPIYNTAQYLRQCVDSVLNQSYKNISVALVDDGSTDGSGKICDEYARVDSRVSVIHQDNQGMIKARYAGAKVLDCDYITTVDSDDWIAEETYSELAQYMEREIDVITFLLLSYFPDKHIQTGINIFKHKEYSKKEIESVILPNMIWVCESSTFGLDPSLCNKLFKKSYFMKAITEALPLNVDYGQDMAILYPLMKEINTLRITGGKYYYHRQREKGVIPSYILDSDFDVKTKRLTEYLKKVFDYRDDYKKQLEFFYTYSFELRLYYIYQSYSINQVMPFFQQVPFGKIEKNRDLVLFGAGKVGKSFYKQLNDASYCKSITWVDNNHKLYEMENVKPPEILYRIQYDNILIAVNDENAKEEITAWLKRIGVPDNKIIR